jgi:hypothetical protein
MWEKRVDAAFGNIESTRFLAHELHGDLDAI